MLKRLITLGLLASAMAVSMSAQAALIATDWKNSGDNKATLDTETGIEWLDLSVTAKVPLAELQARISNGDLKGWRFATESEVGALNIHYDPSMYSTKVDVFTTTHGMTNAKMDPWRALFGKTHSFENASMGVYQRANGTWGAIGAYREGMIRWYNMSYDASLAALVGTWAGYFLVSDGGLTMSSINDPMLNVNNPNAPVNNQPPAPAEVSAPPLFGVFALLALFGLSTRRKHRKPM